MPSYVQTYVDLSGFSLGSLGDGGRGGGGEGGVFLGEK